VEYRPPQQDSQLMLLVDGTAEPADENATDTVATPDAPLEDINVVVCLQVDKQVEGGNNGPATITLEEELSPATAEGDGASEVSLPPVLTFRMVAPFLQSACFTIPAGSKKLYSVTVESQCGHCLTFSSSAKLQVLDAATARKEQWGCSVVEAEGAYSPANEGVWNVWFRQKFTIPAGEADADGSKLGNIWLHLWDPDIAPYVRLYTIDNDTGHATSHPTLQTGWYTYHPNTHGYTVLAAACSRHTDLPAGKWRLCVATDGGSEIEELTEQVCSTSQCFSGGYVSNKYFTLFRDIVRTDESPCDVVLRLTCSEPNAWLKLSVYAMPVPSDNEVTEDGGPVTELVQKTLLSETCGRKVATLFGLPAAQHTPDAGANKGKEDMPEQYMIEGSIDAAHWDVPEELCSILPFYKAKTLPPADGVQEGDEEAEGGAEDEVPVPVAQDNGDMLVWNLQVVSAGQLAVHHDDEKERVERTRRDLWEEKEPGRAVKAKASRLSYLGKTEEAAELLASMEDPKKADKKGKDQGASVEDEERRDQRRKELLSTSRPPAELVPKDGKTVLLSQADLEVRQQTLEDLITKSNDVHKKVLEARALAVETRKGELINQLNTFASWRVEAKADRQKHWDRREEWRLKQESAAAEDNTDITATSA